ncbi:hypothetical protein L6R49_26390 [Myxococcota bacterium]|nr:hypothetical protein [Myxococcota bacterium]
MGRATPLLFAALGACTFTPGNAGFATLESAQLSAAHAPGEARDLGDDGLLTSEGYAVKLSALTLTVGSIHLDELQGASDVSFDPANPPEGYGLCHGDHCHADTGELVSYAEIIAELAGEDAALVPVVSLAVNDTLDLLAGEDRALTEMSPSADLPMVDILQARLEVTTLRLQGVATPWDEPEAGSWELDLNLPVSAPLTAALDLSVDRDVAPALAFHLDLLADGTLLDELDLGALAAGGVWTVTEADPTLPGIDTLLDNLSRQTPSAFIEPQP